jgi:3-ketosteroid 9alpha-monooxygenase subunit B
VSETEHSRYRALRVARVVDETADSKSVWLDIPDELSGTFGYRSGQFITLRLPVDGRHVPRCYSMSSAPGLDAGLRVTIKRVAGGRGSNWVCDQVRAGDTLQVLPPAGVFSPRSVDGDFLLLAGGSGITPVLSILRTVLARGTGRALLIYANRDERSVIFRDELNALAAAHPTRLQVVHWLDSVQRIPSVSQIAELARPWPAAQAFICGPGPFMDAAVAALQSAGLDGDRVHVERFVSLPDEGAEVVAEDTVAPEVPLVDEARLEIELNGEVHVIDTRRGETVLDAALRHKIDAPFSCQAGLCASCMCQVVQGGVHLRHNEALDQKDLSRGWTLSCQALPTSAQLRVKFP